MQHGGVPELLLGLSYNGTTGRLSVEVIKGSHFRNLAMNRAPGIYLGFVMFYYCRLAFFIRPVPWGDFAFCSLDIFLL